MAYVNMTVDGQTRRTSKIVNKGADGSTKEATLEAVLEASDIQGGGITPSGKKTITNTQEQDVTNYATAQVVDSNLVAGNIKKGVSVLGITGSYEGEGGGSSAPSFDTYTATANCTTYGQVWQMMKNDGMLARNAQYALSAVSGTKESTQVVNVVANGTDYMCISIWRATSCKALGNVGNNADTTACVLHTGDTFTIIPLP